MKSKWTVYIGIFLSFLAIIVSVTIPEVRYFLGFETNPSSQEPEMKEVDLTVQTESVQPLSGVNVEFKSQGAPGTALTDSSGYTKIKIPSTTDVQITLRKEGFKTESYIIDLKKDPVLTRTYTLKSTSSSTPQTPLNESTSVPPSPTPTELPTTPLSPSVKLQVKCKSFGDFIGEYTELISVANKTEQPLFRFWVSRNKTQSVVCKIEKNSGELSLAYALSDDSQLDLIVVKVYVDGNPRKSVELGRGEALREKIDIRGASGYKLEFSVPDKSNESDYVYVIEK